MLYIISNIIIIYIVFIDFKYIKLKYNIIIMQIFADVKIKTNIKRSP